MVLATCWQSTVRHPKRPSRLGTTPRRPCRARGLSWVVVPCQTTTGRTPPVAFATAALALELAAPALRAGGHGGGRP
jgi:hypothetical protein